MFCCGGSKKPTTEEKRKMKKDEPRKKVERSSSEGSVVISEKSIKSLSHVVKWTKEKNFFEENNVRFQNIFRRENMFEFQVFLIYLSIKFSDFKKHLEIFNN